MRRREENKLTMYRTVRDWLKSNEAQLAGYPDFMELLASFISELAAIDGLVSDDNIVVSGISQEKSVLRTALEREVIAMIKILKLHASRTKNLTLLAQVDFTKSQVTAFSEQMLMARATDLASQAEAALPDSPFRLTQEGIDALKTANDQFAEKQTSVRQAIVAKKDAGEQIDAHMDIADDMLKEELDVLLELVELDHPELYNQYKASREIIDR